MTPDEAEETVRLLFMEYGDQVNKFAFYMLGDREDAADAVQEIFLRGVGEDTGPESGVRAGRAVPRDGANEQNDPRLRHVR